MGIGCSGASSDSWCARKAWFEVAGVGVSDGSENVLTANSGELDDSIPTVGRCRDKGSCAGRAETVQSRYLWA
jgi:hypothetical protein